VHIIESDGESALRAAILEKQGKFKQMQTGMVEAMQGMQITTELMRDTYNPTKKMELPKWKS
jgi:hypothetical protein